jgi:predicted DNA-binding protein with PD1-like motif
VEFEQFGNHVVLRLDPGEEVMKTLLNFVAREDIRGGYFVAFGGFSRVRLCYFDVHARQFKTYDIDQQVEVVSLLGNVGRDNRRPIIHMHAAVSDAQAHTSSGHVAEGTVQPTLEVFLTRLEGTLRRRRDPSTGLELLALPRVLAGDQRAPTPDSR